MAIDINKILAGSKAMENGEGRLKAALKDLQKQVVTSLNDVQFMKDFVDFMYKYNNRVYLYIDAKVYQKDTIYSYDYGFELGNRKFKIETIDTTDVFDGKKMFRSFTRHIVHIISTKFKDYGLIKDELTIQIDPPVDYKVFLSISDRCVAKAMKKSEVAKYAYDQKMEQMNELITKYSKIVKVFENYSRSKEFESSIEQLFLDAKKNEIELKFKFYGHMEDDPDDRYDSIYVLNVDLFDEIDKNRFKDFNDQLNATLDELLCPYVDSGLIGMALKTELWSGIQFLVDALRAQKINVINIDVENIEFISSKPITLYLSVGD